MKRFKNEVIKTIDDKPMKVEIDGKEEEMVLWNVFNVLLNNAPFKTQEDSKEGMLLTKTLMDKKDEEFIELEESNHTWLKAVAKELCWPLFRIYGDEIYQHILEGFEKLHQPKNKEN